MLHADNPQESLTLRIHLAEELERITAILEKTAGLGISSWCIFDNTALGAATADAVTVRSQLLDSQRAVR
jgi:hypothetical protein